MEEPSLMKSKSRVIGNNSANNSLFQPSNQLAHLQMQPAAHKRQLTFAAPPQKDQNENA